MRPANTPVLLPRTDAGVMPARSNTSQDASNSTRCCGSIANASRGEMPKKLESNRVAPSRKPPPRT